MEGAPAIVLVGLPGAGKSTVGRAVAERLGWTFVDFDEEIERREGAIVAELFARRGEPYFRERERALTAELVGRRALVMAPGGGWIANPEVVALLRPPGRIIYLRVRPATALARLGSGTETRPLLRGADPLSALRLLLERREPHYLAADHVLDVDMFDPQWVAEQVARLASGRGGE